ncbi:Chromate resistance protein ChrB [Kitasatospora sp. KL5]|uniref:Chromate resistance protein ChrB n=1 Tax=Kitasatospora sp. KL5 TaxID=3425125 RepID=UPI003D6FFCF8
MTSNGTLPGEDRFLLVSVSTAGASASTRVRVWRKLRSLGALYVQQSVCLLPDRDATRKQVRRLLASVREDGGTTRCLTITVPDGGERADLVAEFNAERDTEYAEVVARAPALLAELEAETARGRVTYAEVEESEADLERFDRWMAKITDRDYFGAPGRKAAADAVEACRSALEAFEAAAMAADTTDRSAVGPTDGRARTLRIVGEEG